MVSQHRSASVFEMEQHPLTRKVVPPAFPNPQVSRTVMHPLRAALQTSCNLFDVSTPSQHAIIYCDILERSA
ncbi:unnamed protein product [Acanthoscelides obtectus]|uniref:Uncharacterized protein n=1 Tax=Acanthoscelides obtectus TaxID=200917 RepID=A0A9P0K7J4_ACAOB|nr:unnamed protein product [Acanthoscelides obtectus]CAK1623499.1 hypothetical protein AOBTE_LOCUS2041 [Acanthoscelides obtectus]